MHGKNYWCVGMMVVPAEYDCRFGPMGRRDLKVLDAAEAAADIIEGLIDRSRRRLISTSQMRRSVHSVPANIVEGFGRGTDRERAYSLRIARGEAEETMQHLSDNRRANRISAKDYWAIRNKCAVVVKMLNGLIRD